jgi:hypothetical protein
VIQHEVSRAAVAHADACAIAAVILAVARDEKLRETLEREVLAPLEHVKALRK